MTDFRDKYSDQYIREHASHEDEIALADQLAEHEVQMLMQRLKGQKNFSRRVFQKLGPKLLEALQEGNKPVEDDTLDLSPKGKADKRSDDIL